MRARQFIKTTRKISESQDLFEINMSPSNLQKLAKNIDAQVGIEFEMIVPDVAVEDEDPEVDYDGYDERVSSIDEAVEFFDDGDHNSRGAIRRLRDAMNEEYYEWQIEQLDSQWDNEGLDYLRDYIDNNDIFDRDDHIEDARDYVRELFADENETVDEQSERFLDAVTERLDDLADAFVQTSWSNNDEHYEQAREEFNEEFMGNYEEDEWLRDQGLNYMSDVESRYSDEIVWPYYSYGGNGEMDIDEVVNDFEKAVGRPVNASSRYHGGRREPGKYVLEPDGSIDADAGDGGLEFVSPPLPLPEALSDLQKVYDWAKARGCYTNNSTGLHMNVSVPDMTTAKLDFVKLALLLGDEHVLASFGRQANTYATSALGKIKGSLKSNQQNITDFLDTMKDHMGALASKAIHSGETSKYTSINTKGNYVEFRSPGGDWLGKNWDKVVPTMLRTIVALDAAMDPTKYRVEYQKKLYKLLDSSKETVASPNVKKLLSLYFADDEKDSRQVAVQLAKELLMKKQGKEPEPASTAPAVKGSGRYGLWISGLNKFATREGRRLEFDSREQARDWYADEAMMRPGIRSDIIVKEIPADQPSSTVSGQSTQSSTSSNASSGEFSGEWKIVNANGRELHRFGGVGNVQADANRVALNWLRQNPRHMQDGVEVVPVMR
jgi:hypothetical protein